MLKRLVAVLLAVIAIFVFAACKEDETQLPDNPDQGNNQPVVGDDETDDPVDADEIDYEADLSKERYDGYNFRILVRQGQRYTQGPEQESGKAVDDAVYRRNKQIEEKYGITITVTESSTGGYETDALNSILAGDDAYDLVMPHSRAAFAYAVQGAAYNIHEIESIHLDKPWWFKDVVESCTVNDKLYVLDGDLTQTFSAAMCMFFNKNVFDELGFDYPYEMVEDGEWTFDEFAYLAKKGGKDLNGDGVMKPEDDRYGFFSHDWEAPINILYAGGQKVYDKNDEGELELTVYSNKTVDIFDEFFGLLNSEACFLMLTEGEVNFTGDPYEVFTSGRSMISTAGIGQAETFRNMDDDFGILPYPKFDEDDEYTTAINGAASLMVIPITVSDVERTGAITEALCAYTSRDVIPVFYDAQLKTKHARDDESSKMLDLIRNSIVYDIGYVAGGAFQSCGHDLANTATRDFASYYAANESKALGYLAEFNRDYGGIE